MSAPVLFVSYTGAAWGSDRVLGDFATALEPPVAVACPAGPLAERLAAEGVTWHPVRERAVDVRRSLGDRLATPVRIASLAAEARRVVRRTQPGVVVGWNGRGLLAARAAAGRARLVFHQNELLRGRLVRRAVDAAARRAELVVAASGHVARDLGMRAEVAPGGVDLALYSPEWPRPGPPTALFLGALVPWKRPDLALEAVAIATREIPDLRLVVAGEPIGADRSLLDALRRRAAGADLDGRVEFAGRLADPRRALESAHCLLHCADSEPYGLAMVEALAAGLPVAAPAAGGAAEIVTGECGHLYEPGSADDAARALVQVLRDPEPLGHAARRRAEQRHSLANARQRYRDLIEPLR